MTNPELCVGVVTTSLTNFSAPPSVLVLEVKGDFCTNLFGHGQEPFWQQASTNLVKFVIPLHQTLDDYVTLDQVYEHAINPDKLRAKILEGDRRFAAKHRRLIVTKKTYLVESLVGRPAGGPRDGKRWVSDRGLGAGRGRG